MRTNKANYTLVLTHDIDHLSLRSYPVFSRVTLNFFRCSIWINLLRTIRGELPFIQYLDSIKWCIAYPLIKLGVYPDPWEKSMEEIIAIERKHEVRSTFFFIPYKDRPGHFKESIPAKSNRAIKYDLRDYKELLIELETNGWEVGVHGIDAHISLQNAREELEMVKSLLPFKTKFGMRMHWLFQSDILWKNLSEAGYYYDATFGRNDLVGFPEGQYNLFKKNGIWVIPLNIQDGTLLGYKENYRTQVDPWAQVDEILREANDNHAVVTILWHNNAFGVYHYHDSLYEKIIQKAISDGARICRCIDICEEMDSINNGSIK